MPESPLRRWLRLVRLHDFVWIPLFIALAASSEILDVFVVAPLVEEMTLRGFFLKRLELNGQSFWRANALTTVVFVAMHLPGWYLQGRTTTLIGFAQRAAPLAVLSLLFGWTKKRSGSLYAAIVLHAINNLYSSMFP